jgi:1-pyrroline-5-carboxylate dehydrogenase
MNNGLFRVPQPANEPVLTYASGSKERAEVKTVLSALKQQKMQIPLIIGGKEIFTDETGECIVPHEKDRVIGVYHKAGRAEIDLLLRRRCRRKAYGRHCLGNSGRRFF